MSEALKNEQYYITLGVIAYNEEENIERLFQTILKQTYDHKLIDVLFVDSGSTDKTKEMMSDFIGKNADEFGEIRLLDNPKKNLPAGWNVLLRNYHGQAIVRVDAHAEMAPDFIERNVYHLMQGDMVCGGYRPNIIDKNTPWKRTLLLAESSVFGASIGDFRRNGQDRIVKTVFHGAYKREVFDQVGLFNEKCVRTEDNDMNYRIRAKGIDIWFHPDIISYQRTRETLGKMLRQKYLNGYWIAITSGINMKCLSLYYFVPFVFVMAILFTSVLAWMGSPFLAILMWSTYWLLAVLNTLIAIIFDKQKTLMYITLPVLFFLLHVVYGIGSLAGFVKLIQMKISGELTK